MTIFRILSTVADCLTAVLGKKNLSERTDRLKTFGSAVSVLAKVSRGVVVSAGGGVGCGGVKCVGCGVLCKIVFYSLLPCIQTKKKCNVKKKKELRHNNVLLTTTSNILV